MARFPEARWRGPVPNETDGRMVRPFLGLVLHIEEGTEAGTDAWFHNPKAEASAHFGNPRTGQLDQFVDTNDKAWAEVAGNSYWVSVEHEGHSGDLLTASQLENDAHLLAWLHTTEGVPLQITDDPNRSGLGTHAMGGSAWGGHTSCPGSPIAGQRQQIIDRAAQLTGGSTVPCPAPGQWEQLDEFVRDHNLDPGPATCGQTTGGTHADGSLHYPGRARDYGAAGVDHIAIAHLFEPLAQGPNYLIEELFCEQIGMRWSHGKVSTFQDHPNHTHVGIRDGADLGVHMGLSDADKSWLQGDFVKVLRDEGVTGAADPRNGAVQAELAALKQAVADLTAEVRRDTGKP